MCMAANRVVLQAAKAMDTTIYNAPTLWRNRVIERNALSSSSGKPVPQKPSLKRQVGCKGTPRCKTPWQSEDSVPSLQGMCTTWGSFSRRYGTMCGTVALAGPTVVIHCGSDTIQLCLTGDPRPLAAP